IQTRDETLYLRADVDVDLFRSAGADARRMGTRAAYQVAFALYSGELLPENRYDDWAAAPREELAALAADLQQESDALGDTKLFGLPADTSSFIGRARELAELRALLRRTRLLTLSGTGGTGKTRLALELARSAESDYGAGAAIVELATLTDPRLIPEAMAAALDVRPLPQQELVDALVVFLAQRTMLLVLDNCEHVLAATAALVNTLLRGAPQLTILTTSREPLRVPGEIVFRVPSLGIPNPNQVQGPEQLLEYESVSLFVARAAAAAPSFVLDDDNAADVARICLRLDGLPLALELAAGRLGALSPEAIASRLDDRFQLLRSGSQAAPTRQQTLSATLQWSHDLLETDEKVLFRRLGIFAGGCELEAVEEVCVGDGLSSGEIADALARLAEKSLVVVDDPRGGRRYRLLETVRMYARERLDESDERPTLAQLHAGWALELAARQQGSPRLDPERENLRVALDTLLAQAPREALRLCVSLLPFWLRRIELDEASRRFEQALAAADDRTALAAEALLAASAIRFRAGALPEGVPLAERSRALAEEVGDSYQEWRALQFLGEFGIAADDIDAATPWLERALELARREGFAAAEAVSIHSLGVAAWIVGDLESADKLIARSIGDLRALSGSGDTVPSLLNIAEIRPEDAQGRPGVRHLFQDTLQPFVEVSCDAAASYAIANQAGIARLRHDLPRAWNLLDESEARFRTAGDDAGLSTVLVRRAYTSLAAGEVTRAHHDLEAARQLRAGLSDRRGLGLVLSGLGLVETALGNFDVAEARLAEARDTFRRAGDRWGLASTLWRTADLAFARKDLDAAEAALEEAHVVLEVTHRERWLASTLVGLAEVAMLRGDPDRAAGFLRDARQRYAARDDLGGVASIDERLESVAKAALRDGEDTRDITRSTATTKGRKS
nr:AAA family ATPase [Actinomycetota bacterium]